MIAELGHFALILALCLAVIQSVCPIVGAARGIPAWMAVAKPAAWGQLVFLSLSFAALTYSFVINDFSLAYVANNSNSALPLIYRVSGVWGGHEGSLLLWSLILGFWTVAVTVFSRGLPQAFLARVLGVMGLVSIGFLLFMLLTSNPFDRLFPVPADGADLNPLLQDIGLVLHPPLLYMGYVGFVVAFGFAIAALLGGHLDAAWARWSRPWTTVAWVFLTLGILLGSWWAYYELGWGGWWFWDPVENASFMPWLVGTALIHSLAATEKRGAFKSWTVLLAVTTFSMSLLGTFLVRSGVLTSVHAFATSPGRGLFVLTFLAIVIGGSLMLYAWRAPGALSSSKYELVSRENLLLSNNVLLLVAMATVLLGTIYPLLIDALGLGKISVGPPYFNTVFIPIAVLVALALGPGPLLRWRRDQLTRLWPHVRYAALGSAVLAVLLFATLEGTKALNVGLSVGLAAWVILGTVESLRAPLMKKRNPWAALRSQSRSFYGMTVAHIGVALMIIGVAVASAYSGNVYRSMVPGDTDEVGGYTFQFVGVREVQGPNYEAMEAEFRISKGGKPVTVLRPQKRTYRVKTQPMTEAAIEPGFIRDLYVALGDPLKDGAWTVRFYYNPFVRWIWFGALLLALGGVLAITDRRYRRAARVRTRETGAALPAGAAASKP